MGEMVKKSMESQFKLQKTRDLNYIQKQEEENAYRSGFIVRVLASRFSAHFEVQG